MIKNLVFKGGGVLGIAYAGSVLELEKQGILSNIKKVAGTSAGAIVATLVALKYTPREILDIINSTDFQSFEDGGFNPLRLLSKYGLYKGDEFLLWIKEIILKKTLSSTATFKDLKDDKFLDLHIFATQLNTRTLKRFSFEDTPYTIVAEAVRASMSIPMFFNAFKLTHDENIYVDGGCIYNYPLSAFDVLKDNPETLGLFLGDLNNSKLYDNELDYNSIVQYMKALIETVLDSQNVDLKMHKDDVARTIMIDSLGVSPINFNITTEQKIALFKSGQEAVQNYFKDKTINL